MANSKQSEPDFAAMMKELEEIVAWFEQDELDLDAAIPKFERGMVVAELLKTRLGDIENRVTKIQEQFAA
jgi:exodeoxyribonuclease VII small subunit